MEQPQVFEVYKIDLGVRDDMYNMKQTPSFLCRVQHGVPGSRGIFLEANRNRALRCVLIFFWHILMVFPHFQNFYMRGFRNGWHPTELNLAKWSNYEVCLAFSCNFSYNV